MLNLVIVESPAKAKTIEKYLGKDYRVIASFGHIRDLPSKEGSVDPNADFAMNYQISAKSTKHVAEIARIAKSANKVILAPDPDREGESIAWHIVEVLRQKKAIASDTKIERVVFNSITKNAVTDAIAKPRSIDMDLVDAQQARRALDYLVGFTLSPVLWRKLPGSRSAGRVQSVALRLICEREDEIQSFKSNEYWTIKIDLANKQQIIFEASLIELEGKKIEKLSIANQENANKIVANLENKQYKIAGITKKQSKRHPYPPFTTSSLQQEASRKLGFSASKTMMIAQKLYEGIEINGTSQGLITYMRTDSISITKEVVELIRQHIANNFGSQYLPDNINVFKNKVKNAQEAHEAIRPTDFNLPPQEIKQFLTNEYFQLYELIWKRAVASQMSDVIFDQVIAEITTIPDYARLRAVGSVIKFDGFYKIYREDQDDKNDEEDESSRKLPELNEGEMVSLEEIKSQQHFTEPPPRYGEASLVKKMEELGIGRPSTYATIISVLQDRGYVTLEKKRFYPQELGRIVTSFLKEFFSHYVAYQYTAELENELDEISNGKVDWKKFLHKFWHNFKHNIDEVSKKSFNEVIQAISNKIIAQIFGFDDKGEVNNHCSECNNGRLSIKLGKFGAFLGCSNYPDCKSIKQIFANNQNEENNDNKAADNQPRVVGIDPKTNCEIIAKIGPYGPYLELSASNNVNDATKKGGKDAKANKPKRVSLPKNLDIKTIDLDDSLKLLSLPREVGLHPETKEKIIANIGPYGPYLLYNKKFISVKEDNILDIGLNRAVDIIYNANNSSKTNRSDDNGKKNIPVNSKSFSNKSGKKRVVAKKVDKIKNSKKIDKS